MCRLRPAVALTALPRSPKPPPADPEDGSYGCEHQAGNRRVASGSERADSLSECHTAFIPASFIKPQLSQFVRKAPRHGMAAHSAFGEPIVSPPIQLFGGPQLDGHGLPTET